MNKHLTQETFFCEKFYIYYFQGKVSEDLAADYSDFIGNWQEEGFSFLFFSAPADDIVDAVLAADSTCMFIDQYEMTSEQWHGEEIRSYTTSCFSVSPPWKIAFVNQPGIKHLLLDPGVVFGTGRHQTTSDCLAILNTCLTMKPLTLLLTWEPEQVCLHWALPPWGAEKFWLWILTAWPSEQR